MSIFLCPICKAELTEQDHSLKCPKNHTYDIAAAGYINLLRNESKKCVVPGDSKEMCASRNHFLSKNYYHCLAQGLAQYISGITSELPSPVVVDAACGEGYYTTAIYEKLVQMGKAPLIAGVDIAKYALKYAGKRCKGISFAAASIFDMPLPADIADVVTNIFAPVADEEFRRVLHDGGHMIIVGPGERHLWELKEFLYENPYLNEPKHYSFAGFAYKEKLHFEDKIHISCNEDIMNLFAMTPYYWKTSQQATQRLQQLEQLDVQISFEAHVFCKNV
ncbi:putative RNA methyltransferase [Hydrogenoanaerobacterium sp.]|uniref:putative RNA methyltransferase n=1 Tax=Hydrogenoanaerobacterium sp. TaxID=2953763 RepID=UPI00289F3EF9|nr:methyltransferase domain-containing protein [Hydrogenoanaerobacterium sp.]